MHAHLVRSSWRGVAPVASCTSHLPRWVLGCCFYWGVTSTARKTTLLKNWFQIEIEFLARFVFPLQSSPSPPLFLTLSLPLSFTLSFSISDFIVRSSHLLRRRNRNQNHKKPTKKKRIKNMPQNRFNWSPREWEQEREIEWERWREMEKPDDSNYQLCFVSCHNKFLHIIDGALYIR